MLTFYLLGNYNQYVVALYDVGFPKNRIVIKQKITKIHQEV